jgi:hypothetical protein
MIKRITLALTLVFLTFGCQSTATAPKESSVPAVRHVAQLPPGTVTVTWEEEGDRDKAEPVIPTRLAHSVPLQKPTKLPIIR